MIRGAGYRDVFLCDNHRHILLDDSLHEQKLFCDSRGEILRFSTLPK